jgi:hypothetical protein
MCHGVTYLQVAFTPVKTGWLGFTEEDAPNFSGFRLMVEVMVLLLCQQMAVSAAASPSGRKRYAALEGDRSLCDGSPHQEGSVERHPHHDR